MKIDPNDAAYGHTQLGEDMTGTLVVRKHFCGLTVRAYFAAKAMQGLCSDGPERFNPTDIAGWAVVLADALIAALNKEHSND